MRAVAALFLALLTTTAFCGEIYTWRDSSGKVHFSDTPPADSSAKKLRAGGMDSNAPAATIAPPQKSLAEKELEFRKRKAEADKARAKEEKDRAEAEDRQRNCSEARSQLEAVESGQRIARYNEAGERIILDDNARAQEAARLRQSVEGWCKE